MFLSLLCIGMVLMLICSCFFFQAEDGIRDLVRSRGLGDVYKRQELLQRSVQHRSAPDDRLVAGHEHPDRDDPHPVRGGRQDHVCLLYTSDAADERSSVDLGGRRIIKKKNQEYHRESSTASRNTTSGDRRKLRVISSLVSRE